MQAKKKLKSIFLTNNGTVISDGAMGTELMRNTDKEYDSPLELNFLAPASVSEIHQNYLEAGSNIINTNTFCANRLYLKKYDLADKVQKINVKGAELAAGVKASYSSGSQTSEREILITGSVGPTGSEQAIFLDDRENQKQVKKVFLEQIEYLIAGGVDIITFETFSYHKELALAVEAASEKNIPYFVNMTFTNPTTTDYGSTVEDLTQIIEEYQGEQLLAAGINCITPDKSYRKTWKTLARNLDNKLPISVLYNAGEPELNKDTGNMHYPEGESYYTEVEKFFEYMSEQNCIIGGCCGTTPETIKNLKEMFEIK